MDQAESQPLPGQPERPVPGAAQQGGAQPGGAQAGGSTQPDGPEPHRRPLGVPSPSDGSGPATELDHPVVVGYDGSGSSRHALAYAAGMARRLGRPLLLAYITSPSIFCEPLSGQVIAPIRDSDETHRWLLAELEEVCDREGLDVRIVTRQGSPARELAAAADEFGADALVIGAPARIWHQVAGSVPGWLARHAHCPVIVVP
jgi:nucleotide-binding universal stress UspA family protein